MPDFEFNPRKSASNERKHGIDFIEAQALWNDVERLEVPGRFADEERFLLIGKIGKKHWTAIITYRGERVRIISVRRSREMEREAYEGGGD